MNTTSEDEGIRGMGLCAGIAGLEIGLHLALDDYRTICAVEWDKYAQRILIARQDDGSSPPFPIWDDVTTFDGNEWRGQVDILSAGYPCQPFSLAGNRQGVDDPRHLWPHVARIIGECQPALVFLENVPGHLSLGFPDVGLQLCDLGYRFEAGLFSAAEVGATHQRERMFILAHSNSDEYANREECSGRTWLGDGCRILAHAARHKWRASRDGRREAPDGASVGHKANAECSGLRITHGEEWRADSVPERCSTPLFPPGPSDTDAWRRILAERPDLAPALESGVRAVADGLPRRVDQLHALGNAVVPLVAAHAFRTLVDRMMEANR